MEAASAASAAPSVKISAKCSGSLAPPEAITGTETARAMAAVSGTSKPCCVPSRSTEVSRISPGSERDALLRPRDRIESGGIASAADHNFPCVCPRAWRRLPTPRLARRIRSRAPKSARAVDGGGIHGDFVGAGADDRACIVQGANAAARGEWNRELGGDAADRLEEGGTAISRSGDVEDDEFVGAFGVVARRKRTGSPASRRPTKFTPLTTRAPSVSRQGMIRCARVIAASLRKLLSSCAPAVHSSPGGTARR